MIGTITLRDLLPRVFRASGEEATLRRSEVWMVPELTFTRPGTWLVEATSGAGKSSLCAFVYGERTDYDGTILFDGEDVRTFGIERWCALRTRALAYLPQEMRLFPELTAVENILIKNRLTDCLTEAEIRSRLASLGLADRMDVPAGRLSVGQQQRVAILRALAQPFDFLLVDEPVSHLDEHNNRAVARLIADEAAARGAAVIATSVGVRLAVDDFKTIRL